MMKCTNTLRVILMPIQAGEALQAEDFAFSIEGKAGWLAHNAELLQEDPVTYRPYYQETSIDPSATGEAVESAVVAELNTSRLMVEAEPRLLIHDTKNDREIFPMPELIETFSIHGLNKSPAVFDYGKLKWMNGEYIKAMAPEEFARRSFPFSGLEGTLLAEKWNRIAPLLQQRVEKLDEIPEKIAFLRALPEYGVDFFCNKKSKSNPEIAKTILNDLLPACEAQQEWSAEALSALFTTYATEHGMKLGLPMWGVRIAVSGCLVTPGGPAEIMEILGKMESLRRIRLALGKL